MLTPEQKRQICLLVSAGCDREIAVLLAGCKWSEFQRTSVADEEFAGELARSEASAELVHVRNVQAAAKDVMNWRSSTWWLERRAPNRYGKRDPRSIRPEELQEFINELTQRLSELVRHEPARSQVLKCIQNSVLRLTSSANTEERDGD
jgi:hypothetical protein